MKNVLLFLGNEDGVAIDEAIVRAKRGDQVTLVQCDKTVGICNWNPYNSKVYCQYCKYVNGCYLKKNARQYPSIRITYLSKLVSWKDVKKAKEIHFDYNSVDELKAIKYRGVDVGYGALSTYVTFTRNVMPEMSNDVKDYLNKLMRKEIVMIEAFSRFIDKEHFDFIMFHNGRFARFKPLLGLAITKNIEYMALEQRTYNNQVIKDNFLNTIPHDVKAIADKIIKNWEDGAESEEEKIEVGKSFYEKRKMGVKSGDKVYTANQIKGSLPEEFDASICNIGIFNSSEDEYLAVNEEYDRCLLFPNQYVALKTIFEKYKDDRGKHFYLRIHPNLKEVPFKSHLALYELKYDNVTIIPADAPFDSYALLDACDKILTFDSTMGIEASYWKKPSIAMTWYIWSELDTVLHPNTVNELWQMLDSNHLEIKCNTNCLKYGYKCLRENQKPIEYVDLEKQEIRLFGKHTSDFEFLTLFGSKKTHFIVRSIFGLLFNYIYSRLYSFPGTEPYVNIEK